MKAIGILAAAAGLATLAACGSGNQAANTGDNALTEGIEINADAVNATDVNVTDANAADVNAVNAADANATTTDANAATNNAY